VFLSKAFQGWPFPNEIETLLAFATNGLGALLAVIGGVAISLALAELFKLLTVAFVSIATVKLFVNTSSPVVGIPSVTPSFHVAVLLKLPDAIAHLTAINYLLK
jgi:hypothetical protein